MKKLDIFPVRIWTNKISDEVSDRLNFQIKNII